jgi:hypothetical protein
MRVVDKTKGLEDLYFTGAKVLPSSPFGLVYHAKGMYYDRICSRKDEKK